MNTIEFFISMWAVVSFALTLFVLPKLVHRMGALTKKILVVEEILLSLEKHTKMWEDFIKKTVSLN